MSAADLSLAADYWLLAAPVAGTAMNVAAQLILARIMGGQRLLLLIVIAFGIGLTAASAMTLFALRLDDAPIPDALALAASVLFVYGAAGLVLFALINLGETSLRIRMMRLLLDRPEGIPRDQLIGGYDDQALVIVRLERLKDKAQARVVDGTYYSRPSFLFFAAAAVRLLKRVVYGKR